MKIPPDGYPAGALIRLMGRARAGDTASTEELLAVLHVVIVPYLRARCPDCGAPTDLADDLAQEALIRIAHRLGSCHAVSDGQLIAWALRVAHSRLVDHLRRSRRGNFLVRLDDFSEPAAEERPSSAAPVDRILSRMLHTVLRSLPPDTVELLRLRAVEHASWPEIATALRTTAAGAKRRFQRVQARVRREFGAHLDKLPANSRAAAHRRLGTAQEDRDA